MPKARRERSGKRRTQEAIDRDRAPIARRKIARRRDDRRHRDVVAAAADWLWECDAEGRINLLSAEFEASTGLAPQLLLGKPLAELASADAGSAARDEQRVTIAP